MNKPLYYQICEALLFASPNPLSHEEIARIFDDDPYLIVNFDQFVIDYNQRNSGLHIIRANQGYLLTTRPEISPYIRKLQTIHSKTKLTRAACEVLAIVAYRQPVTLPEIEHVRGVDSGGVIRTLLEKQLITILGKKQVLGTPLLYGTTPKFLIEFGLDSLKSLPDLKDFEKIFEAAVPEEESSSTGSPQTEGRSEEHE
jgi:segregation and condensation protein B